MSWSTFAPPWYVNPSYMSEAVFVGVIARKAGGCSRAGSHWVPPRYEPPRVPTTPLAHGWAAAQAIASTPSRASWEWALNVPSEANRPRTSWITTA